MGNTSTRDLQTNTILSEGQAYGRSGASKHTQPPSAESRNDTDTIRVCVLYFNHNTYTEG